MVMASQVEGSQAIFELRFMFFELLSKIKENRVAKVMHSAYLYVLCHVKHKKMPFLAVLT